MSNCIKLSIAFPNITYTTSVILIEKGEIQIHVMSIIQIIWNYSIPREIASANEYKFSLNHMKTFFSCCRILH